MNLYSTIVESNYTETHWFHFELVKIYCFYRSGQHWWFKFHSGLSAGHVVWLHPRHLVSQPCLHSTTSSGTHQLCPPWLPAVWSVTWPSHWLSLGYDACLHDEPGISAPVVASVWTEGKRQDHTGCSPGNDGEILVPEDLGGIFSGGNAGLTQSWFDMWSVWGGV